MMQDEEGEEEEEEGEHREYEMNNFGGYSSDVFLLWRIMIIPYTTMVL